MEEVSKRECRKQAPLAPRPQPGSALLARAGPAEVPPTTFFHFRCKQWSQSPPGFLGLVGFRRLLLYLRRGPGDTGCVISPDLHSSCPDGFN